MSALPPKADMCSAKRDVRFVPITDMALRRSMRKGPPFGSPSNTPIFLLLLPLWLASSWLVNSYSAGPDVDHADSRQQRSRLKLDYQRGPRHPLRSSPSRELPGSTQPPSPEA